MSNAFALQLPKFDPEQGSVVGECDQPFDVELEAVDPLPDFPDAEPDLPVLGDDLMDSSPEVEEFEEEDHWVPEPDPDDTLLSERLDAAEKLVSELASTVQLLQGQLFERVEQKIQAIAAALFPKLAEDFLAEEIARFLAYAVPQNQSQIVITVPDPIVAELTESLMRIKTIHNRWTIESAASGAAPTVHVDWGDGGFDYDLSTLLAACHAQNFQNGHEVEEE